MSSLKTPLVLRLFLQPVSLSLPPQATALGKGNAWGLSLPELGTQSLLTLQSPHLSVGIPALDHTLRFLQREAPAPQALCFFCEG